MSLSTHLPGRLHNTPLPKKHGLLPLFEAVVNSIHSIMELGKESEKGHIIIQIIRAPQLSLDLDTNKSKRGASTQEPITGFKVVDNGSGFNDTNMSSFETLDSAYKLSLGCRGIGRLLWLKAFDRVDIESTFIGNDGILAQRSFSFKEDIGILKKDTQTNDHLHQERKTCVYLCGFKKEYREKTAKNVKTIANNLLEHCLWYFVREGGAPHISIYDDSESINLDDVYDDYMFCSSKREELDIKEHRFEITHLKLKSSVSKSPFIAWCASSRVVEEESISGKLPGLHGKVKDGEDHFIYACYITSPFLDQHVRPERIGFDIDEINDDLFSDTETSLSEIRNEILSASRNYLDIYLKESQQASRERLDKFVSHRAPRYRPLLGRIDTDKLNIDPNITDKELDLIMHKQLSELESSLLSEGHDVMTFTENESPEQYRTRLCNYLEKASDLKKSDLANYVSHRKVILDILEKAIERGADGKYSKEELVHELIVPMRKTSNDFYLDSCNLWLVNERLTFHNFLASDKPLSSFPITNCTDTKEPDICVLNVFDEPILVSEDKKLPTASLTVIEMKRPMRNDAGEGEDKDPIVQSLGYIQKIRDGRAQTATGRQIPGSENLPGFCYIICDLTPTMLQRCKIHDLTRASDGLGYFGYKQSYNSYIEVISFDGIIKSAKERNRAFFDKLGLPTN